MVNPLPVKKIQAFAKNVEKVIVVEELDGIIEAHCRAIGVQNVTGKELFGCIGEFSQNYIAEKLGMPVHSGKKLDEAVPARPPVMCAGCPHRGLFYTLKKNKLTVLGDIGCYTLGAAAPCRHRHDHLHGRVRLRSARLQQGLAANRAQRTRVAVIGDSTFMHSGVTGLINIAYNESTSDRHHPRQLHHRHDRPPAEPDDRLTTSRATPATKIDLEALCHAVGIQARAGRATRYDLKLPATRRSKEELAADEPSVIISRRPCALLKYVRHTPAPSRRSPEKCVGCKSCMKHRLSGHQRARAEKLQIDNTLCAGCGLCRQLCHEGRARRTNKEALSWIRKNIMIVGVGGQGTLAGQQACWAELLLEQRL